MKSGHMRWLLAVAVSIAALSIAGTQVDAPAVIDALGRLSWLTLALTLSMLLIGALLAGLRLWFVAFDIGAPLRVREAVAAVGIGQTVGALTVQFFGQIAGRSAYLGKRGHGVPTSIVTTLYERLVAAAVSGGLAAAGALYLFGQIALDFGHGAGQFVRVLIGIVLAISAGALVGWGRMALASTLPHLTRSAVTALLRNACLTLLVQLAMAAAYVICAKALAPEISTYSLCAAALIVMFAASLPISFAGWGVREISAVFALSAVGVPTSIALAVSLTIGVLSLVSVLLLSSFAIGTMAKAAAPETNRPVQIDLAKFLSFALPLAAASAVLFQLHVPTQGGSINVNLADPIAVLGGALFVWLAASNKLRIGWRISHVYLHVAAATMIIVGSFMHGWASFGVTPWALQNKLLGWFVLLGYGATGALIARQAGIEGLRLVVLTFAAAITAVVALELFFVVSARAGLPPLDPTWHLPMEGFSQNRNAFSFALLMACCGLTLIQPRTRQYMLPVLLLGFWFAGSRAGWGTLAAMVALAIWLKALHPRELCRGLVLALGVLAAIAVVPDVVTLLRQLADAGGPGSPQSHPLFVIAQNAETSNIERFYSISEAWRLFLSNPLVGTGLGAFMATPRDTPLVIHSTAMWILAEMGVLGFLAFAAMPARMLLAEYGRRRDAVAAFIMLVLTSFAIMSQVHEMLYQRLAWLLLGAALAVAASESKKVGPLKP